MKFKFLLWMLAGILILGMSSCKKDNNKSGIGEHFSLDVPEAGVALSFDIVIQKRVRPLDPDQEGQLSLSERSLMVPEITVASAEFVIDTSGNFAGRLLVQPYDEGYPEGTIGRRNIPAHLQLGRMEFNNQNVEYFNVQGDPIVADYFCAAIAQQFQSLSTDLGDQTILSPEHFSLMMQGWQDAGYQVEDAGTDHQIIHIPLTDGKTTQMLIHKERQIVVGNAVYDASGELLSSRMTYYKGIPGADPEEIIHRFLVPAMGPISETELAIVYQSHLSNISITSNL